MSLSQGQPIVLAHGICRLDTILFPLASGDAEADDSRHYFRLIRSHLRHHGFEVFHSNVSWASSVKVRARELRDQLWHLTDGFRRYGRVNIIAHSMGGLDARHMIVDYPEMRERVASLTTIGTPHLGTSFADWGIRLGGKVVISVVRRLGLDLEGIRDLTTEACVAFNDEARGIEEDGPVYYQAYAGVQEFKRIFLPMKPSFRIIYGNEGPNDGLVSERSARWKDGVYRETIRADHLNQIGWWHPNTAGWPLWLTSGGRSGREAFELKIRNFYLRIARDLQARGLYR